MHYTGKWYCFQISHNKDIHTIKNCRPHHEDQVIPKRVHVVNNESISSITREERYIVGRAEPSERSEGVLTSATCGGKVPTLFRAHLRCALRAVIRGRRCCRLRAYAETLPPRVCNYRALLILFNINEHLTKHNRVLFWKVKP